MSTGKVATTVRQVGGLNWASEQAVVERVLCRRPGVQLVEANPVSQTATAGMPSAHEMMGRGGAAGMSMESMVRDMRNRFLVAAIFSVPILLWSPTSAAALRGSESHLIRPR